jgi:hypothetical protein
MTTETPNDSYPQSWKPRERIERDEAAGVEPLEMEVALAAMDPRDLALMLQRVRAMR